VYSFIARRSIFHGVAGQRAEHPDYEPDLNFKKANAETDAEQQTLI